MDTFLNPLADVFHTNLTAPRENNKNWQFLCFAYHIFNAYIFQTAFFQTAFFSSGGGERSLSLTFSIFGGIFSTKVTIA